MQQPLTNYGQATGYDQFAPGRDMPNTSRMQRTPLTSAIAGGDDNESQPQPTATQYPADRSMLEWRNRQPGHRAQIRSNQQAGYDQGAWNAMTPGQQAPYQQAGGAPPDMQNPLQASHAPASYRSPQLGQDMQNSISSFIQQNGLKANQSDPSSLNAIVQHLRSMGTNAQVDYTDSNGHTGGILIDGHPYQMMDGNNNWTPAQPWAGDSPQQPRPSPALMQALIGSQQQQPQQPSYSQTLLQQLLAQMPQAGQ